LLVKGAFMGKRDILTKVLAVAGTVLTAFPLLAPLIIAVLHFNVERGFRVDWFIPAELFPVVLMGGLFLLWAALRARLQRKWIAWCLGLAMLFLFGGQGLAVVTGLASGKIAAQGVWWIAVLATIALYVICVAALTVNGILMLRGLFRRADAG